jgi:hypothetical protein
MAASFQANALTANGLSGRPEDAQERRARGPAPPTRGLGPVVASFAGWVRLTPEDPLGEEGLLLLRRTVLFDTVRLAQRQNFLNRSTAISVGRPLFNEASAVLGTCDPYHKPCRKVCEV